MLASGTPPKFPLVWAAAAGGAFIRTIPSASQIGVNPGFASLTDGFVPLNMTDTSAGGIPPFGQDMNGILKQVTQSSQWQQAGGTFAYDSGFSASIGGYPAGAVLASSFGPGSDGWISLADNNAANPDAAGDGWTTFGRHVTGDLKFRLDALALPGWVKANGGTIGSPGSGATLLAAASAAALYAYFWNNFSNSLCPVTGGRGGNAAADFAANKPLAVYDLRGTGIQGMDTMGGSSTTRLTGVPVTAGSATTAGSLLGENLHALTSVENGPHAHGYVDPQHLHTSSGPGALNAASGGGQQVPTATNTGLASVGITISSSGSGTAHNTVQLSAVGTWHFKV